MYYQTRNPLSKEQIEKQAPAVFADAPAEKTSSRYQQIRTAEILDAMHDSGFVCVQADQQRALTADRLTTNKHLLRFRDLSRDIAGAGHWPEIVLTNSHDGGASYTLYCGIFRMVCSNGMIAGSVDQAIRIRHQGADVPGAVVNASNQIMSRVNDVQSAIENWQGVTIDARAEEIFQDRVSDIIDPDGSRGVRDLKRYLTRARRQSDTAPTLWNIYNRAQENVMNGMYYIPNNSPHRRRGLRSARRITSIDANIKFNAALWDLASNFQAQLVNAN